MNTKKYKPDYYDYEFTWSFIKTTIDEFNEEFFIKFYVEPFLTTDTYYTVGIFNLYGLFIFFEIDQRIKGALQVIERKSDREEIVTCKLNPDLIQKDILRNFISNESVAWNKKRLSLKRKGTNEVVING